jgi:cupin superfamily acireductone dioxygenase involved in methionine salvage
MGKYRRNQLTKLAELSVGDHECSEGLQTLCSLGSILLASILIDGEVWALGITGGDLLSLPDEVLKKFTLVLDQEHLLSRIDNIAQV